MEGPPAEQTAPISLSPLPPSDDLEPEISQSRQSPPATPLLDRISEPSHLRRLNPEEMVRLAGEIRSVIVATVSANGGHLGSNLGIVELTIALHRVYDSPRDVILFDTGHQTYPHKLLTGRRGAFASLRRPGGMSGYPSRMESPHDWIENSHASTALSYAHGLASAFAAAGNSRRVAAVVGDGSLTGGMSFEGLNNLGHSQSNVTIVLNDNGRSYAPTVSRLSESLVKIRSNPVYRRRQRALESIAESVPWVGDMLRRGIDATKAAVRQMWEPPAFFEQLGVSYMGPYNGHDIAELEKALSNVEQMEGPTVVHVITQKGRGYAPAEADPIKNLHDMSSIREGSYTDAFSQALLAAGRRRPEVAAITAAMPDSTGLLPFMEEFPERSFDVGIAEQHAVTMAAGMAMGGMRPVVAVYSTFLTRALDQINLDAALHGCPVVFGIDRAGVTGDDGPSPSRRAGSGVAVQNSGNDHFRPFLLRGGGGDAGRGLEHHRRALRPALAQNRRPPRRTGGDGTGAGRPPSRRRVGGVPDWGGEDADRRPGGGPPVGSGGGELFGVGPAGGETFGPGDDRRRGAPPAGGNR